MASEEQISKPDQDEDTFISSIGEQHIKVPAEKPVWVEDSASPCCHSCQAKFTFFQRRHHCRGCGNIFDAACAGKYLRLPTKPYGPSTELQRVCNQCFRDLSSIDYSHRFDTAGYEKAPALILLHPELTSRRAMLLQLESFKKYFRVWSPDLPGHGSLVDEKLTLDSAVNVVAELIKTETTEQKALVFGYSMGGLVAIALAARHPELCAGIIVGGCCQDLATDSKLLRAGATLLNNRMRSMIVEQKASVTGANIPPVVLKEALYRPGQFFDCWTECIQLMEEVQTKAELMLGSYQGPVLFVNGEQDSRELETAWMAATQRSQLKVVPNAPHLMLYDPISCRVFHHYIRDFAELEGYLVAVVRHTVEELNLDSDEETGQQSDSSDDSDSDAEANARAAKMFSRMRK